MRELINIIESTVALDESTGLANRKPNEVWKDQQGNQLTFQKLEFFPPGGGTYPDAESLIDAKTKIIDRNGLQVHWTNNANQGTGGFGIATFADSSGNPVYAGKWFKQIQPNFTNNKWGNSDVLPGFVYQSKAADKEKSGYKPSDILTDFKSNTPDTIAKQIIAKFGNKSDEAQAVMAFINADSKAGVVRVPKGNMQLTAFRDYFCEMLQPIALVRGMNIKGNAAEAAKNFFGVASYGSCVISFNEGVTGGLYDSLLVNDNGKQIKLSSKGEEGAMASVVNFLRCINELESTQQGRKLRDKHQDVIDIINTIDKGGHFGGPLELALHYGIIDADDVYFVPLLKNVGPYDQIDWGKHKKLEKLYTSRKARNIDTMVPAEHMIAAVAYKVAEHVNEHTNFSSAASEILNVSALVQMYTFVQEVGTEFHITFEAKWPSTAVTGVKLSAEKTYMSTAKGGGNMVFKILKGGAKDTEISDVDTGNSMDAVSQAVDAKIEKLGKSSAVPGLRPKSAEKEREKRGVSTTPRERR